MEYLLGTDIGTSADTITREKLRVLADHGVDRISINPQTMNQKTLDAVGRRHSVEQAEVALETARLSRSIL